MNQRICSNSDCHKAGIPQPSTAFYPRKYQCITCCRILGRESRERMLAKQRTSPYAVDRERHIRLDGDPWRVWLWHQIDAFGGLNQGGMNELSQRTNTPQRVIHRWLRESKRVDLDVVDRALCAFGTPWVLRELWPELYAFDDELDVETAA
jgi:hypothetical protein